MAHVKSVKISLFGGIFDDELFLRERLNIISGVNGTGKTSVLNIIKTSIADPAVVTTEGVPKAAVYNPKRNSERQTIEAALQLARQQGETKSSVVQETFQKVLSAYDVGSYDSLGILFVYDFEERSREGTKTPQAIMGEIIEEYNEVLKQIFPEYELVAEWDSSSGSSGSPDVKLITRYGTPIELNSMSTGESEVLALIFNIYFNRSEADLYLIDEPELHLNWTLERGLFNFFTDFSSKYSKQIVVTTHSRIIFDKKYKDNTQFFIVIDDKIKINANPPREYLEEIAGETASIIQSTAPEKKTFFVEDEFHKDMIGGLLTLYGKEADIVIVKDSSGAIKNLYKVLKSNNEINAKWFNAYLMIDGDGEDEMYKEEPKFIHLRRYCGECYFFEIEAFAKTLSLSIPKTKKLIMKYPKQEKNFQGKHKELIKLMIGSVKEPGINLKFMSSFDTSAILSEIIGGSGFTREHFMSEYLKNLKLRNNTRILDSKLRAALKA